MASMRTWRTAVAGLVLVVLATTGTAAAAKAPGAEAHYCTTVDAYRIKACARANLPATPVGRQLEWVLAQLAGDAATLTGTEVRAHISTEFLTAVMPPPKSSLVRNDQLWESTPPGVIVSFGGGGLHEDSCCSRGAEAAGVSQEVRCLLGRGRPAGAAVAS
jgi:hypothetical protein